MAMKRGSIVAGRAATRKLPSSVPQRNARDYKRKLPIGAEIVPGGGVHFRVWAPNSTKVSVALSSGTDRGHVFARLWRCP